MGIMYSSGIGRQFRAEPRELELRRVKECLGAMGWRADRRGAFLSQAALVELFVQQNTIYHV
jgi:hypothetical protein